jgi:uncharacterized membrane protein
MNRRMKIIFTISLLANIVFIGVGAGLFFKYCQDIPIPGDMSPEARHFVARTLQEGREQVKPLYQKAKANRQKVEDIIMAETFDKAAYDKAVDELLGSREGISRKRAEIMGKALGDLPASDRRKFARRIVESLEGKRPHKGGYHKKMMGNGPPLDAPPGPPRD